MFFALIVMATAATATASDFIYSDLNNQQFHRWVLTESRENNQTLLLVIDQHIDANARANPDGHATQETIGRKLFTSQTDLDQAITAYEDRERAKKTHHKINSTKDDAKPLWVAANLWSAEAEADYSNWVANTDLQTYFANIDIQFDCADFALLTRWVYARNHSLPAANTLAGSGQLFGNFSSNAEWDHLTTNDDWQKDERFKAALRYLLDSAYTHSVSLDLYPIEISRTWVTPGSILLILYNQQTGHTQVVKSVGANDFCRDEECVTVNYGNEPASNEVYHEFAWYGYANDKQLHGNDGYLRWRWPELTPQGWSLRAPEAMPGFSKAEYQLSPDDDFQFWVANQLNLQLTDSHAAIQQLQAFQRMMMTRFSLVSTGALFCFYQPCTIDSDAYNSYSTPSRDARLREASQKFLQHSSAAPNDPGIANELNYYEYQFGAFYQQFFGMKFGDLLSNTNGALDHFSSDPREPLAERWGFQSSTLTPDRLFTIRGISFSFAYADRDVIVERGHAACAASPCALPSVTYQQNDTTTRDAGLKLAFKDLLSLPVQQPSAQASLTSSGAYPNELGTYACGNQQCTIWQATFGHIDWVTNMTSNPNDVLDKRYGAQRSITTSAW